MINLVLLLFFGMLLAFAIDRDFEDVFPPFIFTLLLGIFGLGLIKKVHHAFFLSLFGFAAIWIFYIIRKKKILPSISDIKEKFTPLPIGFISYVAICLIMLYCYHNHFVIGWDDFHFNAMFPRDLYYYHGMPTGFNSTTYYKAYPPLMQLFYYWGFQGAGRFSEPLMYQYKIILIYTCMLPLFKRANCVKGLRRIATIAIAVVLPYISLIEVLDSLSMDCFMAAVFAYAVIIAVFEDKRDWFCYYRIIIAIAALSLVKTIAPMFAGIAMGIWMFAELADAGWKLKAKKVLIYIAGALIVVAAFMSWKVFCSLNGNTTYLSENLKDNMASGGITLPEYGISTIKNILKSLFTMHLNFGAIGLTVFGSLVVIGLIIFAIVKSGKFNIKYFFSYLIMLCGFIVFVAFLMYTYLFLFEDWEALELSSLDRYLGTYVQAFLTFACFHLMFAMPEGRKADISLVCTTAVLAVTLNFPFLYKSLIPSAYMADKAELYETKCDAEQEAEATGYLNMTGRRLVVVSDTGNNMYLRTLVYAFNPMVTDSFLMDETTPDAAASELVDKLSNHNSDYVYFTKSLEDKQDMSLFSDLSEDGIVHCGIMYEFNKENGKIAHVKEN